MTNLTPHPWHWDEDGQLIGDGGFLIISAGINKAGGAYVSVSEEDQSAIATTPELLEALMKLRFAVSMGPLDITRLYGPDAHPDIAINTAARIADTAIAKATGGDTI